MTESEQAKAALAALANGECERSAEAPSERRERAATRARDDPFEWGADGTASQTAAERADAVGDYRAVIERAVEATEDVEAAAAFAESVGRDRLEAAVERAEREVSELAGDGREALETFERFRAAATGSTDP